MLGILEDCASVGVIAEHHLGMSVFRPYQIKAAKCERFELVIALQGGDDNVVVRRADDKYDGLPHYYPVEWHPVDARGAVVYRAEFGSEEPGVYSVSWCGINCFFEIAGPFTRHLMNHSAFVPIVAFVRDSSRPFCRRPRDSPLSIGVFERAEKGIMRRRMAALDDWDIDLDYESLIMSDRDGTPVLYDCSGVVYLGIGPKDDSRPAYEEFTYCDVDHAICYVSEPDPWLAGYSPEVMPAEFLTGIMNEALEGGALSLPIEMVKL